MQTECIRYTNINKEYIQTVAVCGGSGSFLLNDAKKIKADIFITADYKYHQFFDAENDLIIADIGHYESEQFTKELICEILNEKFTKFTPFIKHKYEPNQLFVIMAKKATTQEFSVEDKLYALHQLQSIDSEIDKIRTIRGELPEVQDLEDDLKGLETRIAKLIQKLPKKKNLLPQENYR